MGKTSSTPSFPVPGDEARRLVTLRDLRILDTDREEPFDEIVQLAALLCNAPVALVSFVDEDRQWFKSTYGWDGASTPRDVALCAYTILEDVDFVVEDVHVDQRVAEHPIRDAHPDVRFYAGVPLRPVDAEAVGESRSSGVGTLCVVDTRPRQLSEEQLVGLRILARQAERLLRHRVLAAEHRELADRKAQLRQRYDALTETMLCGVVVHGRDGAVESANPAAEAILGLTSDQLRGTTAMHSRYECVGFDGARLAAADRPAAVSMRTGVPIRDVVMGITHSSGDRRWVLAASTPLRDASGDVDGAVVTLVDVTKELDLRSRLERSLTALERSSQEHAALTAAITHDLAAPAAATRVSAETLVNLPDGHARAGVLAALLSAARLVEERIKDLSDVTSRVRRGGDPERVHQDISAAVVRGCACADRPIEIVLPPDPVWVDVDALQIERIVDNLVSNACKHSTPAGEIVITLIDGADVTILVDDDGPEIPQALRDEIFEPFRRLTTASEGHGVGLYLVRQFARFHGGTATCDRRPGGGNRFAVTIARGSGAASQQG